MCCGVKFSTIFRLDYRSGCESGASCSLWLVLCELKRVERELGTQHMLNQNLLPCLLSFKQTGTRCPMGWVDSVQTDNAPQMFGVKDG